MHTALRAGLTIVAAAVLVPLAAPMSTAAADPATQKPSVSGSGPDDPAYYVASGLAPNTPTTVTLDAVDGSYHHDLPRLITSATGTAVSASGQRTPGDLTPGAYTITFTQAAPDGGAGIALTTPPFQIVPPALQYFARSLYPGETTVLTGVGLGAGATVHRTLTIDGATVPSTPAAEYVSAERFTVPASLSPGGHVIALTQNVNPAVTVSESFSVASPSVTVSSAVTTERGSIVVSVRDFGQDDDVAIGVQDAAGASYELGNFTTNGNLSVAFNLPGLADGPATVFADSQHNNARASAQFTVVPSELRSPQLLKSGAELEGPHGYASFQMQSDGNLVLYVLGRARWNSRTSGNAGAYLAVQSDGNLVVYSASGTALWTSHTAHQGVPVRLAVQDDGNVVLYDNSGRAVWSTGTAGNPASSLVAGQTLAKGGRLVGPGNVALVMQSDGNAVLYGRSGTVVWSTKTAGNPNASLTLQTDGNLVVYSTAHKALWSNRALVGNGAGLTAQGDGNLVEFDASARPVWQSGTSGR